MNCASDLKTRIGVLLGRDASKELIEMKGEADGLRLEGFLTRPAVSRKSMAGLYLHVNGRPVQARNICYSIKGAYGSLLHDGHFPIGALFLEIPAKDVDVNVHPAKTIVRIAREEKISKSLREIIKTILSEQALIANVNLENSKTDSIFLHCLPAHRGEEVESEVIDGPRSKVWAQAHNRLYTSKALIEFLLQESIS